MEEGIISDKKEYMIRAKEKTKEEANKYVEEVSTLLFWHNIYMMCVNKQIMHGVLFQYPIEDIIKDEENEEI